MARLSFFDFDPNARLADQRECNLGVLVPIPISERLEKLTEILTREGHGRVPRKELVGALIHSASADATQLAASLRKYRTARVGDALLETEPVGDVVTFRRRRPGPRARPS